MDGATDVTLTSVAPARERQGVHDDQNPECDDRECERHIEGGPGGRNFWAVTRTAITAIQPTLITPSTLGIAISPMLELTQQTPNASLEPAPSQRRRRKCRLSGVSRRRLPAATSAPAAGTRPVIELALETVTELAPRSRTTGPPGLWYPLLFLSADSLSFPVGARQCKFVAASSASFRGR
jgi:hypothetical protein